MHRPALLFFLTARVASIAGKRCRSRASVSSSREDVRKNLAAFFPLARGACDVARMLQERRGRPLRPFDQIKGDYT
jgi:hypothetical protein